MSKWISNINKNRSLINGVGWNLEGTREIQTFVRRLTWSVIPVQYNPGVRRVRMVGIHQYRSTGVVVKMLLVLCQALFYTSLATRWQGSTASHKAHQCRRRLGRLIRTHSHHSDICSAVWALQKQTLSSLRIEQGFTEVKKLLLPHQCHLSIRACGCHSTFTWFWQFKMYGIKTQQFAK